MSDLSRDHIVVLVSHCHLIHYYENINIAALNQQSALCLFDTGEKCGAPCTIDQFTCANGCCLDPGLECDSKQQCSDGSDEQNCKDCEHRLCKLGFIFIHALEIINTALK